MSIRSSAVAGAFYPSSKALLIDQLRQLFGYWNIDYDGLSKRKRVDCKGIVAPHAGYPYSGYVAARVFADVPQVDTVVLIGPNHYGIGPDFSISLDDSWETPLGIVDIDKRLADTLIGGNSPAQLDELAHLREHSIEVQLPILQSLIKGFKIVPISVKHYHPDTQFLAVCKEMGEALATAISNAQEKSKKETKSTRTTSKNVLIVASTDFTHYEPQKVASTNDDIAMKKIETLDAEGLFEVIQKNHISMCGYAGVATAIFACKSLGSKKAERVAYMTSGDTTGDKSAVVGYGGLRIL